MLITKGVDSALQEYFEKVNISQFKYYLAVITEVSLASRLLSHCGHGTEASPKVV
jgi:hypothetical protein